MDDRAQREQVARLARAGLSPLHPLSGGVAPLRRIDRGETRGAWRSYRGVSDDARRDTRSKGDAKMNFHERLNREIQTLYKELRQTPPLVIFVLSCLALLLVGAILVGASK